MFGLISCVIQRHVLTFQFSRLIYFGHLGGRFKTPWQCNKPKLHYCPRLLLSCDVTYTHDAGVKGLIFMFILLLKVPADALSLYSLYSSMTHKIGRLCQS